MVMYAAGIACPDDSDVQIRFAGRGGLGALMGSKGIKAIVVDDSGSTYKAPIHDKALLQETSKWMAEALLKDPKTENRNTFGTPAILALASASGLMPTRNFSSGTFEKADDIAGERVREEILARGGQTGKPCVTGCVIQCSNLFPDKTGKKIVASLQYESICLLGSNCGIGSLDDIAEMNYLCNQVGVDSGVLQPVADRIDRFGCSGAETAGARTDEDDRFFHAFPAQGSDERFIAAF